MPARSDELTASEAAALLGVKLATLYAYVSRGLLGRTSAEDGRASRFNASEVQALAASRRRPAETAGVPTPHAFATELAIDTSITTVDRSTLRYRGRDASKLATQATFEAVAELLWGNSTYVETDPAYTWAPDQATAALARRVSALLPPGALLADQLRAMTAVIAGNDPLRFDVRPDAVADIARTLIASLVEALPQRRAGGVPRLPLGDLHDGGAAVSGSLAGRLWLRLSPVRAEPSLLGVLNAALVLLADHELATSTFGVRVAASTRSDPYACIAAGLGVVSGRLHGAASAAVHQLLLDASQPEGATAAVARRLRAGESLPGFGHALYPEGDPRATALLALLHRAQPNARRLAVVDSVLRTASKRQPSPPNVDFALAALAYTTLMPADAGEAIFAIARTAGWIAHVLEEYESPPLRYRLRAQRR